MSGPVGAFDPARVPTFLPMTRSEMAALGWDELDVLLISGDAYLDHPSFAVPLLGKWLVAHGFRVGVVAQPDWRSLEHVASLGRPRLFAGVSGGALDSMLAHYTAFRKKRSEDACTPGGKAGKRPNRATLVYANLVRQAFAGLPVVLGGIEASMRRVTHYDFWEDALRRSILCDTRADVLVYGMGERALLELARVQAAEGGGASLAARALAARIPGIAVLAPRGEVPDGVKMLELPAHEDVGTAPFKLMELTLGLERQCRERETWACQPVEGRCVVLTPPPAPDGPTLDRVFELPYARAAHPLYRDAVPALESVRFSITSHRGCGGGCTFCSLTFHQGKRVESRSRASILREVRSLTRHPAWRGSIADVGGPTANMWGAACANPGECVRSSCLYPEVCPHYGDGQGQLVGMLRAVQGEPGVRHLRTATGIRHDLARLNPEYMRMLVESLTGGQLKLAPEHCVPRVLRAMRKPPFEQFLEFLDLFERASARRAREQYTVPYLVSAFPGCTEEDMRTLSEFLRRRKWRPQQVQCFIPTPGTVATAMFYCGRDEEGRPIPVARTDAERMRQHALLVGHWGRESATSSASTNRQSSIVNRQFRARGSRGRNRSS